jgi:hypothetical protein
LLDDGLITGQVSVRTVQRFVKRQGLKNNPGEAKKDRKAFEEAYFGAMWMADTCYFPYITENGATMDRFLATRERIKPPQSNAWLDECFMNRERRKVRNDATVSIHKTPFDAPMQFIGQTVEIRFLPDQMEDAYIFDAGRHFPLKRTDKQANAHAKRQKSLTVDYSRANGEA